MTGLIYIKNEKAVCFRTIPAELFDMVDGAAEQFP
jgi:hypothetical protein